METIDASPTYTKGRFIYDADSHIVEPPTWLKDYAAPSMRDRIPLLWTANDVPALVRETGLDPESVKDEVFEQLTRVHESQAFREKALANVMVQKQLNAFGAFRTADRKVALDQMGFQRQMVFNTFSNQVLQEAEAAGDIPLVREMARAHNRAIVDFCSADARLMGAGYVPLSDIEQAQTIAEEAIALGCRSLIVASACPPHYGPTHVGLDGVWAAAAEAGAPIVLHVGGTGEVLHPNYNNTGRERTPDFKGGEGSMTSLRVLALPNPAKILINAMVLDGVFMNHPGLRLGVFELGASWVPSLLQEIDSVARGFKMEPRIRKLDLLPSDYIARQVKVTPYPYEDVGWMMANGAENICMFCSDFPHHEGSKDPIGRFDDWLKGASPELKHHFYVDNFVDFVGGSVPGRALSAAA